MAEEEIVSTESAPVASPVPSDHKRKLEEMEAEPKEDSVRKSEDNEEDDITNGGGVVADVDADADGSDAKRPRLDDNEPNAIVYENGSQENEKEEHKEEAKQPLAVQFNSQSVNKEEMSREASEAEGLKFETILGDQLAEDVPSYSNEHEKLPNNDAHEQEVTPKDELQEQSLEIPSQKEDSGAEEQPSSGSESISRKIEVPNNKVGVLIGKAGDTIRFLQINSGARIQIMRDDDANLSASTRPVELIGNAESINQAEKLIKDVIAEADAGGSPSLVARGICTVQTAGVGEQILIQVPNEKVGLIIGKGGETIKNLQTRSGARIQLIPQHPPEGDQSKERTVRVTGDKKQIEMAREMIKEVMNQSVRPSTLSGGYSQQAYRPRGPAGPQWGPQGPHFPPTGCDYQQRRPYPSQNPQYPTSAYVNYPHQQMPSRGSFGPGWDSRPSATMHGPPQGGGYNYYGAQGGRVVDGPMYGMPSYPVHSHGPGPSPVTAMGPPPAQANYNYGQAQPDYGQSAPYAQQTVQPSQSYGHGYNEVKYENQTHMQHPYGGQGGTQTSTYPQGSMVQGYGPQDQYGKPLSYNMPPPQGNQSQSYGQSRATQPGDVQYQGLNPSAQSYGPGAPTQQSYPYGSSMPMQSYPPYGSAPTLDGYNNSQPATASVPGYPQQSGQPAAGYSQSIAQQAPGYGQVGATAGYGAYPSSQPVYPEQTATNANYGYQGAADPAYGGGTGSSYGAAPTGQPNYTQPAPTQPGYEQQSITPSAAYGPTSAPVAYGKSSSPQPGYHPYESNQMYGTHT